MYYVLQLQLQGRGLRQASELLDQSYYVRQLGCAVGGVLVLIAKSEWRGGDQKKMEKMEFDMPIIITAFLSVSPAGRRRFF